MGEAGLLTENDRVELVEGWIVTRAVHSPEHDGVVDLAQEALRRRLPAAWRVRVQSAITTQESEPEPDIAVARGTGSSYLRRHPRPEDISLVVEVADSSLKFDRHVKGRAYAKARIPVYWIVNLVDRQIEVYSEPDAAGPAYKSLCIHGREESVPLIVDGRELAPVPVREVLA